MSVSQSSKIPISKSTFVNDSQNKWVRTNQVLEEDGIESVAGNPNQTNAFEASTSDMPTETIEEADYQTVEEKDDKNKKKSKCWEYFKRKKLVRKKM
ncbi:unnamed protein product [Brachionus calyciflorus]|uniref:Uncharacterized protein n=1 Tax=Brachionus calyciflorus TaxID=104777 RepID=A0A814FTY0_9BILA|nr:unnamed protein product [Brachionus calyciflorus]